MTKNGEGPPQDELRQPAGPSHAQGAPATAATLSGDELVSFLVAITREVWRLQSALDRSRSRRETISDEVLGTLERLQQDLQSLGLEVSDPVGQTYDPGLRVEIAHLEPGGAGDLVIKRTVLPGVILKGRLLKPASVVVGREQGS